MPLLRGFCVKDYLLFLALLVTVSALETYNNAVTGEKGEEKVDPDKLVSGYYPNEDEAENILLWKIAKLFDYRENFPSYSIYGSAWPELDIKEKVVKKWVFTTLPDDGLKTTPKPNVQKQQQWKKKKGRTRSLCYFKLCSFPRP